MAGVTAGNLDVAMNEHILGRLRIALEESDVWLRIAEKAEQHQLTGQSLLVRHQIGRTSGIVRPSAAGASFPSATQGTYKETTVPLASALATIECTDQDLLRAADSAHSMVQLLTKEAEDLITEFRRDINAMFIRGSNGALATVVSYTDGTPDVVTVDDTSLLQPGESIDFYRSGSPVTDATAQTIVDITSETTFTVTSITGTPASGDTIHRASSYGNEPQGLEQIISATTTLQGVAATAYYFWQANVAAGSSLADFNPKTLKVLLNKCEKRVRRKPTLLMADMDVASAMAWVQLGTRQFVNAKKFEGYWDTFTYDGHQVIIEHDAPSNTLYVVDKKGLLFGRLGGEVINLVKEGGATQRLATDGSGNYRAAWQRHFTSYAQLGCTDRRGHGKYPYIYGLSDSGNGYAPLGGLST